MNDNGYGPGAALAVVVALVFVLVYLVVIAGVYALVAWMLSRVFQKAGVVAWKAWVPVFNYWVFFEMGGQLGWIALLGIVPGVNIVAVVFACIAAWHVGSAFQKPGAGWLLLYIFLPVVWIAIVAFDSSKWEPGRMTVRPIYGPNVPFPMEAGPGAA
ncbi:MAG TPA: hypothetical protein DCP11_05185 [Microbacteriaceae bacterium]|nr:hypothetical protein [Microbacteriaceae bacterium]